MLSFLVTILIGSVLLALPISSKSGVAVKYIDALFTATSATCVTGLVVLPTVTTWSAFGQVVLLILIQIGGLGVITLMSSFMLILNKRIGIKDSQLIGDSFNLNSLSGLKNFLKKVLLGTFLIELAGALLYMTVFVPQFGFKGVWISVFNSVSAFCNAGIDVISETSLCDYATNPIVNGVTCALIIIGGIGFIVWWDFLRVLKSFKVLKMKCFSRLTLHSKIAILTTAVLIVGGAVSIFIFEYNNPLTIKDLSFFDKIQVSFFQSVTTRTAGFATIDQSNFTDPSSFVSLFLMFVGGSPAGTAGGIKTVTLAVLFATAVSTIKNKAQISAFNRSLSLKAAHKAVAVAAMSFAIAFSCTILLSFVTNAPALDIVYEAVSATATVGLSRNLTGLLNHWGKIIVSLTMFLGRVGPISLMVAFNSNRFVTNNIKNPVEDVSVG